MNAPDGVIFARFVGREGANVKAFKEKFGCSIVVTRKGKDFVLHVTIRDALVTPSMQDALNVMFLDAKGGLKAHKLEVDPCILDQDEIRWEVLETSKKLWAMRLTKRESDVRQKQMLQNVQKEVAKFFNTDDWKQHCRGGATFQIQFGRSLFASSVENIGNGKALKEACSNSKVSKNSNFIPELEILRTSQITDFISHVAPGVKCKVEEIRVFELLKGDRKVKVQVVDERTSGDLQILTMYGRTQGLYKWDWLHASGMTVRLQLQGKSNLSEDERNEFEGYVKQCCIRDSVMVIPRDASFRLSEYWKRRTQHTYVLDNGMTLDWSICTSSLSERAKYMEVQLSGFGIETVDWLFAWKIASLLAPLQVQRKLICMSCERKDDTTYFECSLEHVLCSVCAVEAFHVNFMSLRFEEESAVRCFMRNDCCGKIADVDLVKLGPEAYKKLLVKRNELQVEIEVAKKLKRLQLMSEAQKYKEKIMDEILGPSANSFRCPKCMCALEFSGGCMALTCKTCSVRFCGYCHKCFTGKEPDHLNSHSHAKSCEFNKVNRGDYDLPKNIQQVPLFNQINHQREERQLQQFFDGLKDLHVRAEVIALLQRELEVRQIKIKY